MFAPASPPSVSRRAVLAGAGALALSGPMLSERAWAAPVDDALVAAAKKEGKGTLYSIVDPTVTQGMIAGFKAKYGIEIEVERLIAGPLAQRLGTEYDSGNAVCDITIGTDKTVELLGADKQWFAPASTIPGADPYPQRDRADYWVIMGHVPYSLVWNTTEFKDPPTGWRDLLDPKYKDRLLLIDPRIGAGPAQWYLLMRQTYGDDFLRGLGRQGQFVGSVVPGLQQIASGAKSIYAPAVHLVTSSLVAKGAPLGEIFPGPTVATENYMSIMARAPHPNVARLLAGYILSAEGQALANKDGFSSLAGVPGTHQMPPLTEIDSVKAMAESKQYAELLGVK